jgi:hypothetical protein
MAALAALTSLTSFASFASFVVDVDVDSDGGIEVHLANTHLELHKQ